MIKNNKIKCKKNLNIRIYEIKYNCIHPNKQNNNKINNIYTV